MTFSTQITLGNVLTILSIVFAVGMAYAKIGTLEAAVADQRLVDAAQNDDVRRFREEIREDIKEVHRKLDRLVERGSK